MFVTNIFLQDELPTQLVKNARSGDTHCKCKDAEDKVNQLESTKWITDAKFDYFEKKIAANEAEIAELKETDE